MATVKKYEFTDETLEHNGHILHRIKALRDFGNVKAGELGGWLENENNLSQDDDCWVYDDAMVFGEAGVFGHAKVYDDAVVYGWAWIYDEAKVYHNAQVSGHANIFDNARVFGDAKVCGHAWAHGNAKVFGNAMVCGNAEVYGYAEVYDDAKVGGDAKVNGNAEIGKNAEVKEMGDYMVFQNTWSSGRWFTWTRSNNLWKVGCFYGTGKELIEKAYKDSKEKGNCYKAYVELVKKIHKEIHQKYAKIDTLARLWKS